LRLDGVEYMTRCNCHGDCGEIEEDAVCRGRGFP
jgi:hypothetical protein